MDNGVFYESVGANTITLSGVISWGENANTDYDLKLIVTNAGEEVSSESLASFVATGTLQQRRVVIARTLRLSDGDRVALRLVSTGASTDIEVTFNSETYLNISNKEDVDGVKDSECYGMTVYEAFSKLAAGFGLSFKSDFFSSGAGQGDFLTNGNNIRGIISPVNMSFEWLFVQLSKIYDLEMNLSGGVLSIEQATDIETGIWLEDVTDGYTERVNIDLLYSSVKAGYSIWQSESKLKGVEFNSQREYETKLIYGSRPLDLVAEVITSGYVIEEQRRIQFDVAKSKEGYKYDENIFLIALDGTVVEKLEKYNPVLNVLPSGGVYNFKYSPTRIVINNKRRLKHVGEINYVSGQGNSDMVSAGISEKEGHFFGDKLPHLATFRSQIEAEEFDAMDTVTVNACGQQKKIKVREAAMALSPDGKGFVDITGEVI